jgi:hypothetical protein
MGSTVHRFPFNKISIIYGVIDFESMIEYWSATTADIPGILTNKLLLRPHTPPVTVPCIRIKTRYQNFLNEVRRRATNDRTARSIRFFIRRHHLIKFRFCEFKRVHYHFLIPLQFSHSDDQVPLGLSYTLSHTDP